MARPRMNITAEELEKLGTIHATQSEIAAFFSVDTRTIERRLSEPGFREAYERGRAKGRMSLRRKQIQVAEEGNATMLIWLGKQLLGQRDVTAMELSGPDAQPVQVRQSDLSALSIAELEELYRLRQKMENAAAGNKVPSVN